MALASGKDGSEERPHQIFRQLHADNPRAQYQDVYIIVFDALVCRIGVMTKPGTDAVQLVRGDGRPDAAAADQYASFRLAPQYRLPHSFSVVRVVHGRGAVRTLVQHFVPELLKKGGQSFLHGKPSVIRTDRDTHSYPPLPPWGGQLQPARSHATFSEGVNPPDRSISLIPSWTAQLSRFLVRNYVSFSLAASFTASIAGFMRWRGSISSGCLLSDSRKASLKAIRSSVSMLMMQIPFLIAPEIVSSPSPLAPCNTRGTRTRSQIALILGKSTRGLIPPRIFNIPC